MESPPGPPGSAAPEALSDQTKGIWLAVSSSFFIGISFIIKKKGLRRAGVSGIRAGSGGYSYLTEPLWWLGLLSMVVGEAANFAAYAFAPAILVTPLGALSILVTAVASHHFLRERLSGLGVLGCVLCVTGSVGIVVHAPEAHEIRSVAEAWELAKSPPFALYTCAAVGASLALARGVRPEVARSSPVVYVLICSAVGSLSVVSCQALGVAAKLALRGSPALSHPATWVFLLSLFPCLAVQMSYLNRALDLFNPAVVTPLYYVCFTTLTIVASSVMFRLVPPLADALAQGAGFATTVCGTALLQATQDVELPGLRALLGGGGAPDRGKGAQPPSGGARGVVAPSAAISRLATAEGAHGPGSVGSPSAQVDRDLEMSARTKPF